MDKKHVCQADSRCFKTAAALAQHRADAHGSSRKGSTPQRVRPVRQQKSGGGAVVSTTETVRGQQTDLARLSGVDRVFHGPISQSRASGWTMCDLLVTPGLFKRLAVVARAYQKVRYLRLRFRVEPQAPTTVGGGYVAAFVRDPADDVRDINALTSQQGSVTTKWWQSSVITTSVSGRDFYTSDSVEVREFSPGRFVVMVDGPATQDASVTIFAEWSVSLTMATLEGPTVQRDLVLLKEVWAKKDHIGLFGRNDSGEFDNGHVIDILGPNAATGDFYSLEVMAVYPSSSPNVYNALTWLYVRSANDLIPCWGMRSERDEVALSQDFRVLRQGTVVRKYVAPTVTGEVNPPSPSGLPTRMADSVVLHELCTLLCAQMGRLSEKSETFSTGSHGSAERSVCMGKPSLVESPLESTQP